MKRLLFAVAIGLACLGSSAWAASDDLVEEKMLLPETVSNTKMLMGDTTGNEIMALVGDPGHMIVNDVTSNDGMVR